MIRIQSCNATIIASYHNKNTEPQSKPSSLLKKIERHFESYERLHTLNKEYETDFMMYFLKPFYAFYVTIGFYYS